MRRASEINKIRIGRLIFRIKLNGCSTNGKAGDCESLARSKYKCLSGGCQIGINSGEKEGNIEIVAVVQIAALRRDVAECYKNG
jgi:hypothetical protein